MKKRNIDSTAKRFTAESAEDAERETIGF